MRVFLGITEIAGYYRGLKAGFDELGVPCTFVDLGGDVFRYGGSAESGLIRVIRRLRFSSIAAVRKLHHIPRYALFRKMAREHDVFIFGFGSSLLHDNLDLAKLRAMGKTVICQFHGSDARPPWMDGAVSTPGVSARDVIALTAERKRHVERIGRHATWVVDNPTHGLFHERPFVNWLRLGITTKPRSVPAEVPAALPAKGRTIRVLHTPSHPIAKGTDEIRAAVARLRAKGLDLELVEITGKPNDVVMAELARCDFCVDQVYADYGMPGFATEAAWMGKAVVIGGYARELWARYLPRDAIPPTHYCAPDEIEQGIEKLAVDHEFRGDLARRARRFVETHWSARAIAEKYVRIARGDVPAEWLVDPREIRYWHGACLPESRARELIGGVVGEGGVPALQLADKPELERWILDRSGVAFPRSLV